MTDSNPLENLTPEVVQRQLGEISPVAKGAQILQLVKDNQLITAAIVFVLWRAGALSEALAFAGC